MEERIIFRASITEFVNSLYWYEHHVHDFSRDIWACDPNELNQTEDSFVEVPLSYKGFISNERNLNRHKNCRSSCSDYTRTRQFVCGDNSACVGKENIPKELLCGGLVQNCVTMENYATACVAVRTKYYSRSKYAVKLKCYCDIGLSLNT